MQLSNNGISRQRKLLIIMLKVILCSLFIIVTVNAAFAQVNDSSPHSFRKDTTVVGVVIDTDSIFFIINDSTAVERLGLPGHHKGKPHREGRQTDRNWQCLQQSASDCSGKPGGEGQPRRSVSKQLRRRLRA
jgi:hypothetical protein